MRRRTTHIIVQTIDFIAFALNHQNINHKTQLFRGLRPPVIYCVRWASVTQLYGIFGIFIALYQKFSTKFEKIRKK